MRIAMWSGPRNLSTAMMYSFGARPDCQIVDEPFYAAYLEISGLDHPMRGEILASQNTDANIVAQEILVSARGKGPHFYQKHMAQHMLPDIPRDWMSGVKNVFLIRHPARVVASYAKKREEPVLADLGFAEQAELFDYVVGLGQTPVVIDSADIRQDPESMLRALCAATGVPWDRAMLKWNAGGHPDDGVWASHWYGAVHRSTGFAGAEGELPDLAPDYAELARQALPYYQRLAGFKLRGSSL